MRRSISYYLGKGKGKLQNMQGPLFEQELRPTRSGSTSSSSSSASSGQESGRTANPTEEEEFWFQDSFDELVDTIITPPRSETPSRSPDPGDGCYDECRRGSRPSTEESKNTEGDDPACQGSPSSRSKPIPIAIPASPRSLDDASKIPVLSARGDLEGAYFPKHEDPSIRIVTPHPFGKDAKMAREYIGMLAAEDSQSSLDSICKIGAVSGTATAVDDCASSSSSQPIIPDYTLYYPFNGRYHPLNWRTGEPGPRRKPSSESMVPMLSGSPTGTDRSFPQPSTPPAESPPTEAAAPVAQRAQTQTSAKELTAREAEYRKQMASHFSQFVPGRSTATTAVTTETAEGISDKWRIADPRKAITRTFSTKPKSPRLAPQEGTPGHMTPMSLDGGSADYMSRGHAMTPSDQQRTENEVARARRRDSARHDRQASHYPLSRL